MELFCIRRISLRLCQRNKNKLRFRIHNKRKTENAYLNRPCRISTHSGENNVAILEYICILRATCCCLFLHIVKCEQRADQKVNILFSAQRNLKNKYGNGRRSNCRIQTEMNREKVEKSSPMK